MSSIAHLGQMTDAFDTGAKFFRVLHNDGASLERLVHPINDKRARKNLVAFLNAGCPQFDLPRTKVVPVELPPILVFDDEHIATVVLPERHDPDSFWQTTKSAPARYVYGSFRTNVVAKARPSGSADTVKMRYADVSRDTTVRDILDAPGVGDHDPSKLLAIIAAMIARQPNGEALENGLLNDGRGNLFPCGSVLANVHWNVVHQKWHVLDGIPDDVVRAGRRVFSGNLKL
ncbi:MAG TPA: hypothetical protein VJH91_00560 [Candidatus Paceibacterota bacterium]